MRHPNFKKGKFEIRYKQVNYDDRYFFVHVNKQPNEDAKFRKLLMDRYGFALVAFMFDSTDSNYGTEIDRFNSFLDRCNLYDDYLDSLN
jgi:hypothetical protein